MRNLWRTLFITAVLVALPAAMADTKEPQLAETAKHVENRALRRGDRNPHVAVLQRTLGELGFDPGPIDGIFGPLTEGAVKRMQADTGLEVDGLAGRLTTRELQLRLTAHEAVKAAPSQSQGPKPQTQGKIAPEVAGAIVKTSTTAPAPFHLTFHGRPDPDWLPEILAALAAGKHQATFFIHGEAAIQQPHLVAMIHEAGHELGNLGWSEGNMTRMTPPVMEARLEQAQKAIASVTGQRPAHFRPPDGRYNELVLRAATTVGLEHVLWHNVSIRDHENADPVLLAQRLAESVHEGTVLMLHQDRPATVQAIGLLLDQLAGRGYVSVGLGAMIDK